MKKIFRLMWFLESFLTVKQGIIWEFLADLDDTYGYFKNVATGEKSILAKDNFSFKGERYYQFEPREVLEEFGWLQTPFLVKQTWKAVAFP